MQTRALGLALVANLAACGGGSAPASVSSPPPPAAPSLRPEPQRVTVDGDTAMTTASGSTFVAPKGWTVTTSEGVVVLGAPDGEASVTFVERREPDGSAAIAAALQQVRPAFAPVATKPSVWPGRNGWDGVVYVDYGNAAGSARRIDALARRKGDVWYVALIDVTPEGSKRRRAEIRALRDGFRAKGVVAETFRGKTANPLDAARLASFEAFVEEGRRAWQIPGMAVAIVQGGKVVFAKGFGVKTLGKPDPVTVDTLFRIASMSKPLTAAMIAALVSQGRFAWDTRVTELYPAFAVADVELTKRLTMRNMLCGCTGIPYDDLGTAFEYAGVTGEGILERMKSLAPTAAFGERFQYANSMVAAGGYIAAHTLYPKLPLAEAYARAMHDVLFAPLGMSATTFDPKVALAHDHASPHARDAHFDPVLATSDDGAWITPMIPAGGGWSTLHDMAQALAMELADGKAQAGKQVVGDKELLATRELQVRIGERFGYGLAINVGSDRDVRLFSHLGEVEGYTSEMVFMPDHGVGLVMLTNMQDPNPLLELIRARLFELLFDGRDEAKEDAAIALTNTRDSHASATARIDFIPESARLAPFVGVYAHPLYGKITIRMDGKSAVLDAGEWRTPVGIRRDTDGTEVLVATSPTRLGWPSFVRHEAGGKVTLELHEGPKTVLFERLAK